MAKVTINKSGLRKLEKQIEDQFSGIRVDRSKSTDAQARDLVRQVKARGGDMKQSAAKAFIEKHQDQ